MILQLFITFLLLACTLTSYAVKFSLNDRCDLFSIEEETSRSVIYFDEINMKSAYLTANYQQQKDGRIKIFTKVITVDVHGQYKYWCFKKGDTGQWERKEDHLIHTLNEIDENTFYNTLKTPAKHRKGHSKYFKLTVLVGEKKHPATRYETVLRYWKNNTEQLF